MRIAACLSLCAVLVALPAHAQRSTPVPSKAQAPEPAPDPNRKPEHWADVDKNGDGAIDRSEVTPGSQLAARFDARDTNHDGRLTPDEYYLP